jgi:DNA-binding winged helix-turn-helix (wHTH) protein
MTVDDSRFGGLHWRFVGFELDERQRELRQGGQVLRLEPRPMELLMLLLRRPNDLVSKDELIEQVWAGRVVTEAVIARAVAKLRSALGDETQSLIRTVHGFGYRLDVVPERAELPASSGGASPPRLSPGDSPPLRPNWKLQRPLSSVGNAWLVTQAKTGQQRVFKFASESADMHALKREITLNRVMRAGLGEQAPVVPLLDWNLDELPWFIETEFCPTGSLQDWFLAQPPSPGVPLSIRLDLLAQVAEALSKAHSIGVLHKDLKPANILLVEREGALRVLLADFGSGRIEAEHLAAHHITRLGFSQTIAADDRGRGTLSYLAPEILGGQTATTRSDIYALGVMLFQLLVGDLRRPLAPGWEREVEDELLRLDIAAACDLNPAHRLGDAGELAQRLRQLDDRRAALAASRAAEADRQRALRVLETSASRRRWVWALTGSLVLGLVSTGALYWRARSAERDARREAAVAQAINEFLNKDMLGAANPYLAGGGRSVTISSVLDQASAKLDADFSAEPSVYAQISRSVAAAYQNLGLETQAGERLRKAMQATGRTLGEDSEEYDRLRAQLSELDVLTADFAEAQQLSEQSYRFRRQRYGERDMRTIYARDSLAWLRYEFGDYRASARLYEQLLDELRDGDGEAQQYSLDLKWYLAENYLELGRFDDARMLIDEVIDREQHRLGGPDNLRMYWLESTRGDLQMELDELGAAEHTYGQMLDSARATLGDAHPNTHLAEHCLGLIRLWRGKLSDAQPLLEKAYAGRNALHGERHYDTRFTMARLGELYIAQGRYREARELLERAYAAAVAAEGEGHPRTLELAHCLALARAYAGDSGAAETLLLRSLALAPTALPARNARTAWMHYRLGLVYGLKGEVTRATAEFAKAAALFRERYGDVHTLTRMAGAAEQGRAARTRNALANRPS